MDGDLRFVSDYKIIADGMRRNHGYCHTKCGDAEWILPACEEGIFRVYPPDVGRNDWKVERLLVTPASDVAVCDLDGESELMVIPPFHGENLRIYRRIRGEYACIREIAHHSSFLYAIWAGRLHGENVAIIGGRVGERETFPVQWKVGGLPDSGDRTRFRRKQLLRSRRSRSDG